MLRIGHTSAVLCLDDDVKLARVLDPLDIWTCCRDRILDAATHRRFAIQYQPG